MGRPPLRLGRPKGRPQAPFQPSHENRYPFTNWSTFAPPKWSKFTPPLTGSRSGGTTTALNTKQILHQEAYADISFREWGFYDRVNYSVRPILPSGAGINSNLRYARNGCLVERWFAIGGSERRSIHYRLLTNYLVFLAKIHGVPMPAPRFLPPNDFTPAARALAAVQEGGGRASIQGVASTMVRVARAALDNGWDISDAIFICSGEALTESKRDLIVSTGASIRSQYWISEIGPIGYGCNEMVPGCVHLLEDSVAVVGYRRKAPFSDVEVNSLLLTTLLPQTANFFINVEMDDCGELGETSCDCHFSRLGLRRQVQNIWSFGKLTGQGMTLVGSDIVDALERALPERFGGGPGDYQLIERDSAGQTQLELRVSRRVPIGDVSEVRGYFLKRLEGYYGGSLASRVWSHSDGVDVIHDEPIANRAGKVSPLHLISNRPS